MRIYKVTAEQLANLQSGGTISVDGKTYTYEQDALYVVNDFSFPEYRVATNDSAGNAIELYKDGDVVSSTSISYAPKAKQLIWGQEYEDIESIRQKTVAPLVTADTVLTADLAKNIVAVGYFETGTKQVNERWFVMNDSTTASENPGLEAFRWDASDTTIIYAVSWDLATKWSRADIIDQTLVADWEITQINNKLNNKLDKVTSTGNYRVYAISAAGGQGTMDYSPSSTGSTIMSRDAQGKAQVTTPAESDVATTIATKEYVDNHSTGISLTENEDGTVTLNIV